MNGTGAITCGCIGCARGMMSTVAACAPGRAGSLISMVRSAIPGPVRKPPGPKSCAESWGAKPSVIRIESKPISRNIRKVYAFLMRAQQNSVHTYKNFFTRGRLSPPLVSPRF